MNEQGRFSLFFCLTLFDEIHKHRRVGNIQDFSFLHILFGKFVGADYRKPFISGDFSAFSLISKIFYSMSIASPMFTAYKILAFRIGSAPFRLSNYRTLYHNFG